MIRFGVALGCSALALICVACGSEGDSREPDSAGSFAGQVGAGTSGSVVASTAGGGTLGYGRNGHDLRCGGIGRRL